MSSSMLNAWKKEEVDDFSSQLAAHSHLPDPITTLSNPQLDSHLYQPTVDSIDYPLSASTGRFQGSSLGSMATANTLPALVESSTTASSSSSEPAHPSVINGGQVLEQDETGDLVVPESHRPRCSYQCLFHILECDQSFEDTELWRTHVLSHFRTHPAPTDAQCPICRAFISDPRRGVAWGTMLDHVAGVHFQRGDPLAWSRPDIELMRYLFRLRVINSEQLKMVQLVAAPWSPGYHPSQERMVGDIGCASDPVCLSANPRRERRMRARNGGLRV